MQYLYTKDKKIFGELKYMPNIFPDYTKHFHTHFGLALIEKGSLDIAYDLDTKCKLTDDNIAIFNPKQLHCTQANDANGYYVLFLDINWCQSIQKDFYFEKNIIDDKTLYRRFKKLFHKITVDKVTLVEPEFKAIMKKMFEEYSSANIQNEKDIIVRLKAFILDNNDASLSVEKLAKYIGYDKSYLIRFFKKEVGITPQQYILNEKVNKAKNLLTFSESNRLSDISVSSGFFDQSHLNRNFKNLFGTSPKAYKKVNIVQDK